MTGEPLPATPDSATASRPGSPFPITPLQTLREREPVLASTGLAILLVALPVGVAHFVDTRTLAGVSIWLKPLKFHLSLGVYALTLAWYSAWVSADTKATVAYRIYRAVVVACIVFELLVIDGAAAAGTTSHFNVSAPLFPYAYPLMGIGAVILTSMALVQGVLITREPNTGLDPIVRQSLIIGLCLTCIATLLVAGYLSSTSGHLVGGNASDVEALPLTGWARDGGDLRVAHFFATHALHVMPLFGWLLARHVGRRAGSVLVLVFSLGYVALIAGTLMQALDGRPFLSGLPDGPLLQQMADGRA